MTLESVKFQLYLEILTARIRKIPEKDKHSDVARDSVTKLINIFINGVSVKYIRINNQNAKKRKEFVSTFDSYFIDDYLSIILKLMNEFMPFDDMVKHYITTVLPAVPRFFPSFVALVKILKQGKNAERNKIFVMNAKKLLNSDQSKALDEILKGPMTKEILKLAEGTVQFRKSMNLM